MDHSSQQVASRRVLWIGPTEGNEFGACYDQLARTNLVIRKEDPSAAIETLSQSKSFDLAVIACPRLLVTTAPMEAVRDFLAPNLLVQLLGTWCEGEGRTGKIVEAVERVFWHAWPTWQKAWENAADLATSVYAGIGLVEIRSRDAEFAKSLIDTLATTTPAIWSSVSACTVTTPPAVILWDGSQLSGREADELYGICQTASKTSTSVVAMLDFPRPETVTAAHDLGVAAILGKPFGVEQLVATLATSVQAIRLAEQSSLDAIQAELESETEAEPLSETSPEPTSLREQLRAEREQLASEAA